MLQEAVQPTPKVNKSTNYQANCAYESKFQEEHFSKTSSLALQLTNLIVCVSGKMTTSSAANNMIENFKKKLKSSQCIKVERIERGIRLLLLRSGKIKMGKKIHL